MRTRTLITAAVATLATCGAATAVPAQAIVKQKRAYFTATITGLQTTKWSSKSGTYTDCNGTSQTKGEGTEVLRFSSKSVEKITYFGFGSRTPTVDYNGWFSSPSMDLGFSTLAKAKLTRHGQYVTSWSGGWCRGPHSEFSDVSGCGQRTGSVDVTYNPTSRGKVEVDARTVTGLEPFDDCPIATPDGVSQAGWTLATGKLSSKLIFGKRKKIVVTGGKTYRRDEAEPGVHALSTTYFKLTLTRKHPKKVRSGDVGAG